eukprot:364278-Chlamydomonas_euryale.AAC.2
MSSFFDKSTLSARHHNRPPSTQCPTMLTSVLTGSAPVPSEIDAGVADGSSPPADAVTTE